MANWCRNYITFYGKKDNIAEVKKEVDWVIGEITKVNGQEGFAPENYAVDTAGIDSSSDYMFEVEIDDAGDEILQIRYNTKWDVSPKVLEYLGEKHKVSFKGICIEEQERADTCSVIVGCFDTVDDLIVIKKTLAQMGLEIDYMVEEKSYFSAEFMDDTLEKVSDMFYQIFKDAVADAKYQNEEVSNE